MTVRILTHILPSIDIVQNKKASFYRDALIGAALNAVVHLARVDWRWAEGRPLEGPSDCESLSLTTLCTFTKAVTAGALGTSDPGG